MNLQEMWNNVVAFWNDLEQKARVGFVAGAAGILLAVILLGVWVFGGSYQVLFSDLDPRDAATIVEELKRAKVPYKLEDAGTKVLVDEEMVHETRLRLMAQGAALNGGVGFEIFDNKDAGMTEYSQKINYQRALQGELARTIMAIEQVKHARVHLVVAETGLFKRDKAKPKASVSVVLKPGARLSDDQIIGIQRLVGASVPNLEAAMVTVLDQRGVTLSPIVEADDEISAVSGKLKLKKTTEDYLARKIAEVMDRTFGPGQAIVSVDATLDFDQVHRTLQSVIPLHQDSTTGEVGAVVRKRQSTYRQPRSGATKVADGEGEHTGASNNVTSTTEIEYEVGKSVEQIVTSPGSIRRISVGVIVPAQLGEEQVERIRSIVRMVVGFNAERGDAISVQPIDQLILKDQSAANDAAAAITEDNGSGWYAGMGSVIDYMRSHLILTAAGVLLLITGIVLMVLSWLRTSRRESIGSMTDAQRRVLLADVQEWIASERASSNGMKS